MKKTKRCLLVLSVLLVAAILTSVFVFASGDAPSAVAKVGTTEYATFDEAVAAGLSTGNTVTLLRDAAFTENVAVTANLKIDLAGHILYSKTSGFVMNAAGVSLYLWSSVPGGEIKLGAALLTFGTNSTATTTAYIGAYAGSASPTVAYADNLTVRSQTLALATSAGTVGKSTVKINGGTYYKTGAGNDVKYSGYSWVKTQKSALTLTVDNAEIHLTQGAIFGNQNVGSSFTATFTNDVIIAPAGGSCKVMAATSAAFGGSFTFTGCEIDGLALSAVNATPTITIGNGCKINTPTDLSGLTSTAKSYTSEDGTTYTMGLGANCTFVSSRSGYEYCVSQTGKSYAPKVYFKNAAGDANREVANWLRGEIPEFRGVPETKIIDGLVCTYGYPDVTRMTAHASFTFTPTLVDFGTPFLGRLSIDSNIRFTVYVPVKAGEAGDLAVNGAALELPATMYIKGNLYYPFEIAVTPSDALRPLMFTYTIGGENFKTPISVFDYLEKILTLDTTTVAEKRIAYALVSYIGETAAKFNASDDYTLGMQTYVGRLLSAYDIYSVSGTPDLPATETVATKNIKGAAFDLGAEASLVVYLSPSTVGNLTVSYRDASGAERSLTVPADHYARCTVDGTDYLAAKVFLPVADYLCDLTLTVGTGSVRYSLLSYLAGVREELGEIPAATQAFYDYVKAADLYRKIVPMDEIALADAYATDYAAWSPGRQGGTEYFNPGSALLAMAINEHHNALAGRDRDYVVSRLKWYVNGFGNDPDMDLAPSWVFAQISMGMAVARQTPTVWNALDADTKERLDFFMSVFACISSFGTDDQNNFYTGPGGNGNYYKTSANYLFANATPIVAATIYFGGADAVNTILANFDYDTYIAKMQAYGFTNMYNAWTANGDPDRIAVNRGVMNNTSALHHSYMADNVTIGHNLKGAQEVGGYGVLRVGSTYHLNGVGLDDLVGVYNQIVINAYSGGKVKSTSAGTNNGTYTTSGTDAGYTYTAGSPKAFIVDGTTSPYEGMEGMMTEFAAGDGNGLRSSTAYCEHDFVMSVGGLSALYELGIWKIEENADLYAKVYVGNSDLIYKLIHGYHSYSKGSYEGDSYESSYAGYLMMKSLWYNLLGGEVVQ